MGIWEAFGPNYSDDSRASSPSLGIFQGEREDVIDWIATNHPEFRDQLEGRKFPKTELNEIVPKVVTRQMVEKLRAALKQKEDAERALREAQG